jgi:hypothetical protein
VETTVGLRVGTVKVMALVGAAVLAAGCFWRSYGPRMAMHTDVLVAMTRKGTDLLKTARFTPENLPELYYPLDRARSFAADAARRSGEQPPPSLRAFEELLAAYAEFCRVADEARTVRLEGARRRTLREATRSVRRHAAAVRRALAAEGRG